MPVNYNSTHVHEGEIEGMEYSGGSHRLLIPGKNPELNFDIYFQSDEQAFAFARKAVELIEAAISEKRVEGDAHND